MAGVVMLPRRERLGIRQIEFLSLSDNRVLSILMFEDNEIQNRILQLDRKFTPSELQQASNYLNSLFAGRDLMTVRRALLEDMTRSREHINELMKTAIDMASQVFAEQNKEDYILAGHVNLMDFKELATDVDKLRALFDAFNTKRDILHLLDQALTSQGIQIFIGEESGYQVLDECSIITSPYQINDQVVGVLGVIGPTRMAYDRVIPIVDVAAKLLGAALNSRD
jgi:heat-inducible transcriptional repressor